MGLDFSGLEPPTIRASSSFPNLQPNILSSPSFELPSVKDLDGFEKAAVEMVKPVHGTTTLAFLFKHGVIVAADSRASMGQYIWGAADCQFWQRNLGTRCRLHELANKRRISVAGASKLLANTLYSYRGMGLSMGTMIAGWDETGPGLFYVDSEGGRIKGRLFSVGSGSTYAYGILDSGYHFHMSVDEAVDLGRHAIYHATFRDGASGGVASVYYVGPEGWKKIAGDDVSELHYKYYPVSQPVVEQEMVEASPQS
ncbi:hypothetical protein O6H91_14G017300 [Diphasiastrum complanatum]|uniref:Uncharacterized protein n=1 Tax=Diphasiastrum complanatum TaxID=34168 RepID=A0ACC2BLZ4_DIPCM|nr:hypothetical protein O6H91_14G017300 [Diphasiastrum complanatum]